MDTPALSLDELRRRLDAIDDRIHDLILERAAVVETVAALKQSSGQPSLRPGREAAILRRLVARHRGPFPRQSLVRLWRELLGGTVAMQGEFAVAVPESRPGLWDLARDHFGGYVPLMALRSPTEVLSAVGHGRVAVGVLPMPFSHDTNPWWPALAGQRGQGPRIIARLPFADAGNSRDRGGDAVVIAAAEADATGADRTVLVIETRGGVSRDRLAAALEGLGSSIAYLAAHTPAAAETWHLIELDGLVAANDPRLAAALPSLGKPAPEAWLLGSYARPLPREAK